MTPHPPTIVCRFSRIALPLLAALAACAPARAAKPTPVPSSSAAPMSNVSGLFPSPADTPVPGSPPPRSATPPVNDTVENAAASWDGGGEPWLAWGTVGLLALSNALAWGWVWLTVPTSRSLKSIFSPRRRRPRQPVPLPEESPWAADLRELHGLISKMKTAMGQEPAADAPGSVSKDLTAPRRVAFNAAKQTGNAAPPESGDLRQIHDELSEIRALLGQPGVVSFTPAAGPLALPEFDPDAAVAQEHRLTDEYNNAARQPRSRDAFLNQFGIFRFGVRNRADRFQDARIEPVFGGVEQGDYLAVPLPDRRAAIFPRFQTPLTRERYQVGAIDTIFQCPDRRPDLVYHQVTVTRPAIFEATGADDWRLVEQGELDLGPGQVT